MSSAPIGENSVASAIVITPPCPLLKYPAGTFLSTTSMMPPKRGATHPPYELFMDELRRIPLLSTPVNRPSSGAPEFTRWHHACGGKVGWGGSKRLGKEEDEMRLLYIVTKGMGDPTLASVPLHIAANGSLDIGQEVSVVLVGDATDLVIEDNLQRLEGVGVPPARELLGKLKEHEVPVYV